MRAAGLAGRDSVKSNMAASARDIVHSGACFRTGADASHAGRKTRLANLIVDQPVNLGIASGNRRAASAITLVHVMWRGVAMVIKVGMAWRKAHIMVPMIVAIGLFRQGKAWHCSGRQARTG